MSEGLITGLDLTLRRLSSIENSINRILGTDEDLSVQNKSAAKEFKNILDEKLNENTKTAENNIEKTTFKNSRENIENLIEKYAAKNNLDPDFIKAVVKQESGFNPDAKSKCGAMGLMQLMPQTAKGLGVVDAFDPEQNIEGGVKYLKSMLNRFNNDPKLALAAYNAGPGAVQKYGDIPPYRETQNYVKNIMSSYEALKEGKI
ncbi:TPA: lytic transglycosylase domain-containing protein [Candidatus Galligastranaerophilus faecipullorum]|nr:lytic transglycosylase domain-containing protein [Candidatus Galligastranaerophilus faecipullorum]